MEAERKQLISVKEARKQMGKASDVYSDAQVESIIEQLTFLATITGKAAHEQVSKKLVPKSL